MKIKLIKGNNFHSVLNSSLKEFDETKSDLSVNHFVIVPDRFSLIAEKRVFSALGISCTFNISVLGISKFASRVFKENNLNFSTLNNLQENLLVRKAILKCFNEFKYFKRVNPQLPFCEEIKKTIMQLKSCNISYLQLLNNYEGKDEALINKIHDLALIYKTYEEDEKKDLVDSGDYLLKLGPILEKSEIVKNSKFIFVGFDGLTQQGYEILENIMKLSREAVIGIVTADKLQKNYFVYDFDFENKIRKIVQKYGFEIEETYCENLALKNKHIVENLYLKNPGKINNDNFVSIFSSANISDEIEQIAKTIKYLIIEEKLRFRDIGIAVGDLNLYKNKIENIFMEYNIPYFIDDSLSLLDTNLYKFLISVLRLVWLNFRGADYIDFLGSLFVDLAKDDKDEIINNVVENKREGDSLLNKLNYYYENNENIEKNIEKTLNYIKNNKKIIKKENSGKIYIDFLKEILVEFDCKNKLNDAVLFYKNFGNLKLEKLYDQVFDKFFETICQMENYTCDEVFSFPEFISIFESALSAVKVSTVPISVDCALVGDASDSFFDECSALFIAGANSENLPRVASDIGIISDRDIDAVVDRFLIEPTIQSVNIRNRQKLFNLFSCANKFLYVSFLTAGEDGKKLLPANFVFELQTMFVDGGAKLGISNYSYQSEIDLNDDLKLGNLKLAKNISFLKNAKLEFIKQLKFNDSSNKELLNSLYYVLSKKDEKFLESINCRLDFKNTISPILEPSGLFFKKGPTAVSEIESYFKCPFLHFAQYGLKLRENPEGEIMAVDIGNILHKAAEIFCKENLGNLKLLQENEIKEKSETILDGILNHKNYEKFIKKSENKPIIKYLFKEFAKVCKLICFEQRKSRFEVKESEYVFDCAFPFCAQNKNIRLIGKIDRIDECGDNFRVIDYKTGNFSKSLKDTYLGLNLQLFVYAGAYEKLTNKKPVAVLYFPIKKGSDIKKGTLFEGHIVGDINIIRNMDVDFGFDKPKSDLISAKLSVNKNRVGDEMTIVGNKLTGENFDSIVKYCMDASDQAIKEILMGNIQCSPIKEAKPCEYCAFKSICGFDQINNHYRKFGKSVDYRTFSEVAYE